MSGCLSMMIACPQVCVCESVVDTPVFLPSAPPPIPLSIPPSLQCLRVGKCVHNFTLIASISCENKYYAKCKNKLHQAHFVFYTKCKPCFYTVQHIFYAECKTNYTKCKQFYTKYKPRSSCALAHSRLHTTHAFAQRLERPSKETNKAIVWRQKRPKQQTKKA